MKFLCRALFPFCLLLLDGNKLLAQKITPINCDTFFAADSLSLHCGLSNCVFLPKFQCGSPAKFEMQIFDRWGNVLFTSNNANTGWDGKNSKTGNFCPIGFYHYSIKYAIHKGEKMKKYEGNFYLID